MKLVRYGPPGKEKPGLIDAEGKLRDLSKKVKDIDGAALAPAELARLAKLDPSDFVTHIEDKVVQSSNAITVVS